MDAGKNLERNHTPRKSAGFALTSELVLVSTIAVLGLTAGLTVLRDATMAELNDLAEAVGSLNQSYAFHGIQIPIGVDASGGAFSGGSFFTDAPDTLAGDLALWQFIAPDSTEATAISLSGVNLDEP